MTTEMDTISNFFRVIQDLHKSGFPILLNLIAGGEVPYGFMFRPVGAGQL